MVSTITALENNQAVQLTSRQKRLNEKILVTVGLTEIGAMIPCWNYLKRTWLIRQKPIRYAT